MKLNQGRFVSAALFLTGLLFLLTVSVPVLAQTCSINAWSGTTGTPLPRGDATSPAGLKYEQSCGLTIDADAEAVPAYVTTEAPSGEPSFSLRFYILPDVLTITSGDVTVLKARNDSTTEVELRLRSIDAVTHLVALYQDGGSLEEHPNPIALQDVWTGVEVSWSAGDGTGTFGLDLDSFPKYSRDDLDNDGAVINEVDLGIINSADVAGELVFDAFDMRRTTQVGLLTLNEMFGISTRADVRTSDEIVIGGFLILGDTDKCVVVRGRALTPGELPAGEVALEDPTLVLYEGSTVIGSNNDWQDSAEQAQTMSGLGLEPPLNSDSAIYACLAPGGYTAHLTDVDNGSGLGIVEVFDADEGTPYLWGISTRSVVETANKVAIGGFIIDGDQSKDVVVRGRGPSLAVPSGQLSDPQITLYDGATPIETNDDWQLAENSEDIPFAYYDGIDAKDAMILKNLAPGAYTVILEGVGGETGLGIVEVFDVTGGTVAAQ